MMIDQHVEKILRLLGTNKNVLLLGPPASGKSKIMSLVAEKFLGNSTAGLAPGKTVPIPRSTTAVDDWMPSPNISDNRQNFSMSFHQGTKHRDFVTGIIPKLGKEPGFRITKGLLLKANENAISNSGASLILIDEINRGPAVTVFGDTLTSIEADKRLNEDNTIGKSSIPFQAFDEGTGDLAETYLSPHVYIIASMNEADTSVEPLDVAFLRRFKPYRLAPDEQVLNDYFGITGAIKLPDIATEKEHIFQAMIRAWKKINERIAIGRGDFFQIGHGILIVAPIPDSLENASFYAADSWQRIESHIREVFFGNDIAQAVIFNSEKSDFYTLDDVSFGDQSITKLHYRPWSPSDIYNLLKQVGEDDE